MTCPIAPIDPRPTRTDRVGGGRSNGWVRMGWSQGVRSARLQGHLRLSMGEKSLCLHFDRSHVERPSRVRCEYEGRKCNGCKKDHNGGGDCSRDIVDSTVETVHREDRVGCMQVFDDTSLIVAAGSSEFPRSGGLSQERELTPAPPLARRALDPCLVVVSVPSL